MRERERGVGKWLPVATSQQRLFQSDFSCLIVQRAQPVLGTTERYTHTFGTHTLLFLYFSLCVRAASTSATPFDCSGQVSKLLTLKLISFWQRANLLVSCSLAFVPGGGRPHCLSSFLSFLSQDHTTASSCPSLPSPAVFLLPSTTTSNKQLFALPVSHFYFASPLSSPGLRRFQGKHSLGHPQFICFCSRVLQPLCSYHILLNPLLCLPVYSPSFDHVIALCASVSSTRSSSSFASILDVL